ncbi:hypothetical protein KW797_01290, partial [Candidatus Parcubacteria bacterium]|nr:hypothetical protein [Candidatus Parcubacteria bacterium]
MTFISPSKYQRGQTILISAIFFLGISLAILFGTVTPALKQASIARESEQARKSYLLGESALEDIYYRLTSGKQIAASETLSLNGGVATATTSNIPGGKDVVATATVDDYIRKIHAVISLSTGISFHYGVQSGRGGFELDNSSSITGNVYANGSVTGNGNMVYGDVVSTGTEGLVYGIHATGTVYAHTIGKIGETTTIDKDAYYSVKTGTVTVGGALHPGSADQPVVDLPISDDQIERWKSDALAGGTLSSSSCDAYASSSNTCTLSSTRSLGPKKIPFNLLIKTFFPS